MKYTLKNRPQGMNRYRYEEWFEGFEKELRQILKIEKPLSVGRELLIKEILGE